MITYQIKCTNFYTIIEFKKLAKFKKICGYYFKYLEPFNVFFYYLLEKKFNCDYLCPEIN